MSSPLFGAMESAIDDALNIHKLYAVEKTAIGEIAIEVTGSFASPTDKGLLTTRISFVVSPPTAETTEELSKA